MRKESESENRVQLTMAKQQGTLIEVHNLPNDDYFNVGFVVALDQSPVVVFFKPIAAAISPENTSGISCCWLECI